ncbi:MAG TPA: phenylacetate--CoA ligase family protein, partial [Bacteroidia bacterium]|nr:phenylacetate--CoA ligase family protein [Bacteroidia bacterium]
GPVMGRKQQMIKFKGTTLFPQIIFNVLNMMPQIELFQVEVKRNEFNNDSITILLSKELHSDAFEHEISSLFKSKIRVTPAFRYIDTEELQQKVFKTDKRKSEKIIYI